MSVLLVLLTLVAALLAGLLLLPWRAEVRVSTEPRLNASARIGWPLGALAVGWRSGHPGVSLWAGPLVRSFAAGGAPRAKRPRPRRPRRSLRGALDAAREAWARRAMGPALVRLGWALLRGVRLRATGSLALGWDDPYAICQAEGVRLAVEGALRRPVGWFSLTFGRPSLTGTLRVRLTIWPPRALFTLLRWLVGPDGRATLRAVRATRARRAARHPNRGGPAWSSSSTSSGASPTA